MARDDPLPPDRVALLLLLATFLFAGALRAFLSGLHGAGGVGALAGGGLVFLAPLVLLVPGVASRARGLVLAAAGALLAARPLVPLLRGSELALVAAGVSVAAYLLLVGAFVALLRPSDAAFAAAGLTLGFALDAALLWLGDSADPTATVGGLLLVVPAGALLGFAAWDLARRPAAEPRASAPAAWSAALAMGAWLFLVATVAANPYGAARWNGVLAGATATAAVAGLVLGAILLARRGAWTRPVLLALHAGAALALLDHVLLHSPLFPLFLFVLALALAVDGSLLLATLAGARGARAFVLATSLAALLLLAHAAGTTSAWWAGRAPVVLAFAGVLVIATLFDRHGLGNAATPRARRALLTLAFAPALVGLVAGATPAAPIETPDADANVRVLSLDIGGGFAADGIVDPDAFLAILREVDADLVLLQDADTARWTSANTDVAGYLGAKLGYHVAYGPRTSAPADGAALLSRYPIEEWRAYRLPGDERGFLEARVVLNTTDVWIYATRLAGDAATREAHVNIILDQTERREGAKILAGNLASCPAGRCDGDVEIDDVYGLVRTAFNDTWTLGGRIAEDAAASTHPAHAPTRRIDYVFTRGLEIVSSDVVRTDAALRAGGHLPVMADVRVS